MYISLLLAYNERTNVYSKSAYEKLPFHVWDSITLARLLAPAVADGKERGPASSGMAGDASGILDLGSGSGLPSVILACVHPDVPIFAVESKSRKTRFLQHVAREIG